MIHQIHIYGGDFLPPTGTLARREARRDIADQDLHCEGKIHESSPEVYRIRAGAYRPISTITRADPWISSNLFIGSIL